MKIQFLNNSALEHTISCNIFLFYDPDEVKALRKAILEGKTK